MPHWQLICRLFEYLHKTLTNHKNRRDIVDISKIEPTSRVIDIKHPSTDKPIGLSLEIVALSDDRVKAAERRGRDKVLRKGVKRISAEVIDDTAEDVVVSSVVGWTWAEGVTFHGEQPKFSTKNVRKVIAELDFIREQIDEGLSNTADFFQD